MTANGNYVHPMKTLTSLAAALWFALLSGVVLVVFWVEEWWQGEREEGE